MKYSELFCQSNYSFLCGASSPAELVTTASFLGYDALAITDECSVAGVVRAFDEIKYQGLPITLIVGSYFVFDDTLSFIRYHCVDRNILQASFSTINVLTLLGRDMTDDKHLASTFVQH